MRNNQNTLRTPRISLLISVALALFCTACESEEPQQQSGLIFGKPTAYKNQVKPAPVDVRALLRKKRCHICHTESEQLLGPSYEEIGLAYRARKDMTAEILAEKVISGGGGNWGVVPMVANEHVKKNEALTMANWILEFTP
jgi:cytochrome c